MGDDRGKRDLIGAEVLASKALAQSCVTDHLADESSVGHSVRVKECSAESLCTKARVVTHSIHMKSLGHI